MSDDRPDVVEDHHGRHEPLPGYQRSSDEPADVRVRDVLGARTLGLLLGCLVLQALFITSYVGAFHSPDPHRIAIDVAAPAGVLNDITSGLNTIPGEPLKATAVASQAEGEERLRRGETNAVLVADPINARSTLLVSSAQGASLSTAVESVVRSAAASRNSTVTVRDVVPAAATDTRGLTSFYLVVGWVVGGYLMASLLSIRQGNRARNFRRSLWRLTGCFGYALASGIVGALLVDQIFGTLTGHFLSLVGIGTLVVLASSVFTLAATSTLGVFGVGVAVLVFVIAGNPSAGGAYAYDLLPQPWRGMGPWLPNGAGVDAVRRAVYFDGAQMGRPLLVLVCWVLAALALYFLVAGRVYFGMSKDVWGPRAHLGHDSSRATGGGRQRRTTHQGKQGKQRKPGSRAEARGRSAKGPQRQRSTSRTAGARRAGSGAAKKSAAGPQTTTTPQEKGTSQEAPPTEPRRDS
ncbi:hypothetical protein ACMYYO_14510 [Dermacoccaceae bacterium W4C1]